MKVTLCIGAIFLLCLISNINADNAVWGVVGKLDDRVHSEVVKKASSFLKVVTKDVTYPPKGGISKKKITGIKCTDQIPKGKGGYATLLDGGIGFTSVTIHFKSKRSKGFNFIFEVWTE